MRFGIHKNKNSNIVCWTQNLISNKEQYITFYAYEVYNMCPLMNVNILYAIRYIGSHLFTSMYDCWVSNICKIQVTSESSHHNNKKKTFSLSANLSTTTDISNNPNHCYNYFTLSQTFTFHWWYPTSVLYVCGFVISSNAFGFVMILNVNLICKQ